MKTFQGTTRAAFLLFFASHIPITLLIDSQALFPEAWYAEFLRNLLDWHTTTNHDIIMTRPFATWFTALVAGEVFLQIPYFCVALYVILMSNSVTDECYPEWFRSASLVYGAHTATTLIPILATLVLDGGDVDWMLMVPTVAMYLPYLIFPLWIMMLAWKSPGSSSQVGGAKAKVF